MSDTPLRERIFCYIKGNKYGLAVFVGRKGSNRSYSESSVMECVVGHGYSDEPDTVGTVSEESYQWYRVDYLTYDDFKHAEFMNLSFTSHHCTPIGEAKTYKCQAEDVGYYLGVEYICTAADGTRLSAINIFPKKVIFSEAKGEYFAVIARPAKILAGQTIVPTKTAITAQLASSSNSSVDYQIKWEVESTEQLVWVGDQFTIPVTLEDQPIRIVAQILDGSNSEESLTVVPKSEADGSDSFELFMPEVVTAGSKATVQISPADAKVAYKWSLDGQALDVDENSYTTTEDDANKTLAVTVTGLDNFANCSKELTCRISPKSSTPQNKALKTSHIRGGNRITLTKDGACQHTNDTYIAKINWDGMRLGNASSSSESDDYFRNLNVEEGLSSQIANDICTVTWDGVLSSSHKFHSMEFGDGIVAKFNDNDKSVALSVNTSSLGDGYKIQIGNLLQQEDANDNHADDINWTGADVYCYGHESEPVTDAVSFEFNCNGTAGDDWGLFAEANQNDDYGNNISISWNGFRVNDDKAIGIVDSDSITATSINDLCELEWQGFWVGSSKATGITGSTFITANVNGANCEIQWNGFQYSGQSVTEISCGEGIKGEVNNKVLTLTAEKEDEDEPGGGSGGGGGGGEIEIEKEPEGPGDPPIVYPGPIISDPYEPTDKDKEYNYYSTYCPHHYIYFTPESSSIEDIPTTSVEKPDDTDNSSDNSSESENTSVQK